MLGLTTFQLVLLFIITLFFLVGVVGRICTCIEQCAQAKCMKEIYKNNPGLSVGDIVKFANEVKNNGKTS